MNAGMHITPPDISNSTVV